jgi:hypothetical protein
MMALLYVSLTTTYACSGGTLIGRVPLEDGRGNALVTDAIEGPIVRRQLHLAIDPTWPQLDDVQPGRVLRLTYIDNSTADGAFDEYRIEERTWREGEEGGPLQVLALGPLAEFSRQRFLMTGQYTGSPPAVLPDVLAAGPAMFTLGTVTPTTVVEISPQAAMPLAVLQDIGDRVNAFADVEAGEHYAFDARRNGVTDYKLDFVLVGASATVPYIRPNKNLKTVTDRRLLAHQPTRLYITAQGQPIWDADFEILEVQTGYIRVGGVGGDAGLNPVVADGGLVTSCEGAALTPHWITEDGTAYAITGTVRATNRLNMADTTGLTAGDWGRLARNAAGDPLDRLDIPNTEPVIGTLDVPWPPATNHLPNARFESWLAGDPVGWTHLLGAYTEEDTDGLFGGSGALSPSGATGILWPDGGRWTNGVTSRQIEEGSVVTQVIWVKMIDMPGAFGRLLYFDEMGLQITVPLGPTGAPEFWPHDPTVTDGKFFEVSRSWVAPTTAIYNLRWQHVQSAPTVEQLVCGGRLTITPPGLQPPVGFFEGSLGAKALVRGVNHLIARQQTPTTYETTFADLTRMLPSAHPYDTVTLGAQLRLVTPSAAAQLLRIMQVERDLFFPEDTRVTLANRWQTLTAQLFQAIRALPPNIGTPVVLTPGDPLPPPPDTIPKPTSGRYSGVFMEMIQDTSPSVTSWLIAPDPDWTPGNGQTLHVVTYGNDVRLIESNAEFNNANLGGYVHLKTPGLYLVQFRFYPQLQPDEVQTIEVEAVTTWRSAGLNFLTKQVVKQEVSGTNMGLVATISGFLVVPGLDGDHTLDPDLPDAVGLFGRVTNENADTITLWGHASVVYLGPLDAVTYTTTEP